MSKNRSTEPKSKGMKPSEAYHFSFMNTLRRNAHAVVYIDGETVILPSIEEMEAEKKEADNHEND